MLTDTKIRQIKPTDKPQKSFDGEGLYLLTTKKSKRWYLRYQINGKKIERALGRYPDLSLLEARKIAIEAKISAEKGIDPFGRKNQAVTFGEAFELLYALDENRLDQNTMRNRRNRYEKYVKSSLSDKPLNEITPQDVREIILPLHDSGREATAKRVRIIIGQVYRDAVMRYGLAYDPSQASQRLTKYKRVKHHTHIEDKHLLGRLMADIEAGKRVAHPVIHTALHLLPYVFVRPHQIRFVKAADIDFEDALWRISPENSKTRRTHLVPLSRQALAILHDRISLIGQESTYLFPSLASKSGVISENALNNLLRRLGYPGEVITPHGFRGTASTFLHEMGYRHEHIEAQLDHMPNNEVSASYNHASYLQQRRKMMQEWADFLDSLKERYGRE